ncbi:hypothetical protein C8E89_12361 [Mycolicibacterium moriokaense]|uniref:Uncharacterized protein n=1 Tax=Mycolicibacterium moriokaense TaxID=39691 RepID=A0A318H953_9MYCO|nr:hypothetical protein C8E89_12361 [Mycolicibacterium moriokaense]
MSDPFRATMALVARVAGAALALAVAGIHIAHQGGFPGSTTPDYVGVGYYLLEGLSVLTAAALLLPLTSRLSAAIWTSAATFVSAGPLLGYALSRGPGLPDYDDDIGNWTEPLGVLSLVVESAHAKSALPLHPPATAAGRRRPVDQGTACQNSRIGRDSGGGTPAARIEPRGGSVREQNEAAAARGRNGVGRGGRRGELCRGRGGEGHTRELICWRRLGRPVGVSSPIRSMPASTRVRRSSRLWSITCSRCGTLCRC